MEPERTRKGGQWDCIEQILRNHADDWPNREVKYELITERQTDFNIGGKKGNELLAFIEGFLRT